MMKIFLINILHGNWIVESCHGIFPCSFIYHLQLIHLVENGWRGPINYSTRNFSNITHDCLTSIIIDLSSFKDDNAFFFRYKNMHISWKSHLTCEKLYHVNIIQLWGSPRTQTIKQGKILIWMKKVSLFDVARKKFVQFVQTISAVCGTSLKVRSHRLSDSQRESDFGALTCTGHTRWKYKSKTKISGSLSFSMYKPL